MTPCSGQRSNGRRKAEMELRSFEDLDAWQAAHQTTLAVYRATKMFPKEELFGLTSRMRRAAVSVEANLAEGFGRSSEPDFARFARIADGSLQQLKCLMRGASDLGYASDEQGRELQGLTGRTGKLLGGLHAFLIQNRTADQRSAVSG